MKTFAGACLVLLAQGAFAQVELVDPDAPNVRTPQKPAPDDDPAAGETQNDETLNTGDEDESAPVVKPPVPKVDPKKAEVKKPDAGVKTAPEPTPSERLPPPPIETRVISDADLDVAWQAWRLANERTPSDINAEKKARLRLIELKEEVGASNMDAWAVGMLRAADAHEAIGDSGGAVEIAHGATQLAPDLPSTWVGLARVYFRGDPSDLGRVFGALKMAATAQASDPRYRRAALADFVTTLLLSLSVTTVIVLLVLCLRRGFYALYDFHFIFPKAASRWQTGALALVLLSLPIVFRWGLVPVLLTLFFALALYLTSLERMVVAALIALLGGVPLVAQQVVERLAFAGTRAESLFHLERGGTGNETFAAELTRLANEDKASYVELMSLGRYDLRRGRAEPAVRSFRKALTIVPNDPAARVNLGMALVLSGDLENPRALFEEAGKADPTLAQAPYNLGRLSQRRLAVFGDKVAGEVDRVAQALSQARSIDSSFAALSKDTEGTPRSMLANVYLQSVPLKMADFLTEAKALDAARRVKSQVQQLLVGDFNETLALLYPALIAALIAVFGALGPTLQTARVCNKCGRPVSKRADPDISSGSLMCTQCVNVFVKKNVAAPTLKVRKQLEVAKYQSRLERISSVLGFFCSGTGHVFAGLPVRGTLYAFLFISLLMSFVLRNGVLRVPFEPLPVVVRMLPVGVLLVAVYVLSVRGLKKIQGAN